MAVDHNYGTGARAKMVQDLLDNGWTYDPARTWAAKKWRSGLPMSEERVQNPYAFRKPAAHGGWWHVELDYRVRSNYHHSSFDERLRCVEVWHTPDGEDALRHSARPNIGRLTKPSKWDSYNGLYEIFDAGMPLAKRAHALVTNPDLVIWLAREAKHNHNVRIAEAVQRRLADREARNRLPEGVGVEESVWHDARRAVRKAATEVFDIDGKSDVVSAILALRKALTQLEGCLDSDTLDKINDNSAVVSA